jgi:hypothetical protein
MGMVLRKTVSLRQAKPVGRRKRCNECTSETIPRGPVGNQSHPLELANSRKRVWRPAWERSPRRSVDRQTASLDIEPRNVSRREPSLLTPAGAAAARRNGLACRSHRGPRPKRTVTRVATGTWEICSLQRPPHRGPGHRTQRPWPSAKASANGGSERTRRSVGIAKRTPGASATGCRSRSVLVVPHGRRTAPAGSRRRGRGAPGH